MTFQFWHFPALTFFSSDTSRSGSAQFWKICGTFWFSFFSEVTEVTEVIYGLSVRFFKYSEEVIIKIQNYCQVGIQKIKGN